MQIVFNVNFNNGEITIDKHYNLADCLPYIELDIGDQEEIKSLNSEKLTKELFFVKIDYGYGVGTFKPTIGGFAHVTTAYGDETFFTIREDEAIISNKNYFKPNEPYSVQLEAKDIDIILDDITASKINKAGELIVIGNTGPITYTRTSDSTETNIYFCDNRKDKKLAILTYNVSNKRITASII